WIRPVSLNRLAGVFTDPGGGTSKPQDLDLWAQPMHSTPQRKNPLRHLQPFSGPSWRPESQPDFGQTSPSPAAPTAGGVVNSEPFWERPAGTPNTLAPNSLKARTTPLRPSRSSTSS